MSDRPRVVSLADRRPGDDETQVETIEILERALAQAREGELISVALIKLYPGEVYGVDASFERLDQALLGREYLDDVLREWRADGDLVD